MPRPPSLRMFADRVDIQRHSAPSQNAAAGREPNMADSDAAVPCSIQWGAYQLPPTGQAVGSLNDVPVFFPLDVGLNASDVLFVLDSEGIRTGEAIQVRRYRVHETAGILEIWVADGKSNRS